MFLRGRGGGGGAVKMVKDESHPPRPAVRQRPKIGSDPLRAIIPGQGRVLPSDNPH